MLSVHAWMRISTFEFLLKVLFCFRFLKKTDLPVPCDSAQRARDRLAEWGTLWLEAQVGWERPWAWRDLDSWQEYLQCAKSIFNQVNERCVNVARCVQNMMYVMNNFCSPKAAEKIQLSKLLFCRWASGSANSLKASNCCKIFASFWMDFA